MSHRTRLAPSPTGALHLGNARTFLINWLLARQLGWEIVLRVEDIDGPRIKRGADRELFDDLKWLGLDWDSGPIYQSSRLQTYKAAIDGLIESGAAYPCICTRKEVDAAASAPHAEDGAAIYPGTCRGRFDSIVAATEFAGRAPAIRFRAPDRIIEFNDGFSGMHQFDAARVLGDFVIAKADGTPAYQLAVVVDDAEMGITDIVRGDDLLDSTPRQILLYEAMGLTHRLPNYYHIPLVIGTDGKRLAKRHGDTRLSYYRQRGVSAGRVISLLARSSGLADIPDEISCMELLGAFQLDQIPRQPIVFTRQDDEHLLGKS